MTHTHTYTSLFQSAYIVCVGVIGPECTGSISSISPLSVPHIDFTKAPSAGKQNSHRERSEHRENVFTVISSVQDTYFRSFLGSQSSVSWGPGR